MEKHHMDKMGSGTCEKCGKQFDGKEELLIHFINDCRHRNLDPTVICQQCPCKFFSFRNLQAHAFLQHSNSSKAMLKSTWCLYFCEICAKLYQVRPTLFFSAKPNPRLGFLWSSYFLCLPFFIVSWIFINVTLPSLFCFLIISGWMSNCYS